MNRLFILIFFLPLAGISQNYTQEFEDSASVAAAGWVTDNHSSPSGSTGWFPGNTGVFTAHSFSGYYAANYNNASDSGTISNWLISPVTYLQNGDSIIFYTRTTDSSQVNVYADRLQVRLSQNGASVNTGSFASDTGDFTALLIDINPNYDTTGYPNGYPSHWRKYILPLSGLPAMGVSGRFAFRYYVENGGPNGMNSDYIGIDSMAYRSISNGFGEHEAISFSIAPNPSSGNILIRMSEPSVDAGVEVQDCTGRIVLQRTGLFRDGNRDARLCLGGLAPGLYFIRVISNEGVSSNPLIIR